MEGFYHSYSWSWLKYSFEDNCTILTYGWLLVPSYNVNLSFNSNLIYNAHLISFILFWAFTVLFPNKVLWFAFELFHFCFPKISASLKNLLVEKVCPGFFMFGPVQLGTMGSPGGTTHTFLTASVSGEVGEGQITFFPLQKSPNWHCIPLVAVSRIQQLLQYLEHNSNNLIHRTGKQISN